MENSKNTRDDLRPLMILIAVAFMDLLGSAMVFPLIPFYALKLHISHVAIGAIMASFYVVQLISAPIWGRVSDRYGRRPALLVGLAALGIGYLIFGLANSMWMLLLSRIVQGAGGGTTGVTQAYVADTVKPSERARSLGWLSAATNVGTMLGPVIGSVAAYRGQLMPGVMAASMCAINLMFAWKWLPESRKPRQAGAAVPVRKPVWQGVWMVMRHPGGTAQRLTVIYAVGMLGQTCMTAVLALYLAARFGITELTIGYFFLYANSFNVIMRLAIIGPIVDRMSESWAMKMGAASLALGLFLYPLAPNLWILATIIPLIPIGTALLFPATTALLSKATDPSELGAAMGVAQTFAGIARLIAPVAATASFQYVGHRSPFFGAAAIVGVGCLLATQLDGLTSIVVPSAADL